MKWLDYSNVAFFLQTSNSGERNYVKEDVKYWVMSIKIAIFAADLVKKINGTDNMIVKVGYY